MAKVVFFLGYSISLVLITMVAYLEGGESPAMMVLAFGIFIATLILVAILSGQRSE